MDNWRNITSQISFPTDHEMSRIFRWLTPARYIRMTKIFIAWLTGSNERPPLMQKESSFEQRKGRQEVLYRQQKMQASKHLINTYWQDFLDKKAKDPSLHPAYAMTRQFEFHSPELQE